jgi:hypothetical protein
MVDVSRISELTLGSQREEAVTLSTCLAPEAIHARFGRLISYC